MRVLFVSHSFPRRLGDAPGSFLLRLARALGERGTEVRVVAPSAPGLVPSEQVAGIRVDRFRYAPRRWETLAYTGSMADDVRRSATAKLALLGFLAAERAAVARAVADFRPDVVHAHWWFPNALVATFAGAGTRFPMVTTLHGTDVRLARASGAGPLLRRVVRRSAALTAVSRWLAEQVRTVAPEADPLVAPMPAATDLFTPGGERAPDRLLFVGRLNQQKGIERLIRALPHLVNPASLDVVGHGPDEASLRALAASLDVGDRVRWHGALPQDGLVELYRAATALVVPSVEEGLGLVAVEAQLCATPVVAFRSGGLADVVEHGRTGMMVDPAASPEELAAAVDSVLADPACASAMGREGRARALSVFSPEAGAERYSRIYERAAGARG